MSVPKVVVLLSDAEIFQENFFLNAPSVCPDEKLQDKNDIKEWFVIKCFNPTATGLFGE